MKDHLEQEDTTAIFMLFSICFCKQLPVNDLGRPAPPKPLVVKDLGGWRSDTVPISHIVERVVAVVVVSVRVTDMVVVLLCVLLAGLLLHLGELLLLLCMGGMVILHTPANLLLASKLGLHLGAFVKFDIGHASGMGEARE